VAWAQFEAHPWLGSGAGTYELAWLQRRPYVGQVRDAHNLYLETLAELGPVGLALLLAALCTPLFAALAARRQVLVPAAFGAYVAFLAHAAVDWDWEIPAVTLAAVFCAAAMLVAARDGGERTPLPRARVAAVVIAIGLGACAFVGLLGNIKLAKANDAADAGNWNKAERNARSARSWAPWSAEPWQLLAEAQLAEGRDAAAEGTFRKAVAKDPNDWTLWFGLAQVTNGREQRRALAHARRLNPLSPEIAKYVATIRKVPG
jgi:tetratricopeptide (TPR) repeat protein